MTEVSIGGIMDTPLTLNKKYVIRKSPDCLHYYLYDTNMGFIYTIGFKLFFILNLFYNNVLTLNQLYTFLRGQKIGCDDFEAFRKKEEFRNLLEVSKRQFHRDDFYLDREPITKFTEVSPKRIDFLVTKHCNLACKHCFENSSSKYSIIEHSAETVKQMFDSFDRIHLQTLKLTGGEPFSVPYIDALIGLLPNYHFECVILTNGILLNEERIKAIRKGNVKLGISLDGTDAVSHDFLRGKESFDLTYKNLCILKRYSVNFSITISINKMNFKSVKTLADVVLKDFGAQYLFINQLKPLGRAKQFPNIFLSDEEYKIINIEYKSLTKVYGDRVLLSDDSNPNSEDFTIGDTGDSIYCAAGNSMFAINENLDVYPCIYAFDHYEYRIGNLKETTIEKLWNSPKWDIFRGKTKLSDLKACSRCSLSKSCSLKNCRLKPVYEGLDFYSPVSYCRANNIKKILS